MACKIWNQPNITFLKYIHLILSRLPCCETDLNTEIIVCRYSFCLNIWDCVSPGVMIPSRPPLVIISDSATTRRLRLPKPKQFSLFPSIFKLYKKDNSDDVECDIDIVMRWPEMKMVIHDIVAIQTATPPPRPLRLRSLQVIVNGLITSKDHPTDWV